MFAAAVTGCIDCNLVVNRHERPLCALSFGAGADDGGSGRYCGLGYGFEIDGSFVALDPADYGVREWNFYILGARVASGSQNYSAKAAA